MSTLAIQPLTPEAFAPFGEVIDCAGAPDKLINQGLCGRYHDRARLEFDDGRAGIQRRHVCAFPRFGRRRAETHRPRA